MPSKQPKPGRPQRQARAQKGRGDKPSPGSAPGGGLVQRKPFLDLCRQAGWTPKYLRQPVESTQEFTKLLIKELVACREAGQLELTLGLCAAADSRGLTHSRIAANRERALLAKQKSETQPDTSLAKKGLRRSKRDSAAKRPKGILRRLSWALSRKITSVPDPKRRTKPEAPSPSSVVVQEHASLLTREQQLESLKRACLRRGWTPQCLQTADNGDLGLGCALEMQRCRQAGQHALVVALATEAAVLGLDHPRIRENLQRSRAKAVKANVLSQAQSLLDATPPAYQAAITILADAIVGNQDSSDYRKLLGKAVRKKLTERAGKELAPELFDATVDVYVNEQLLDALERRRSLEA